MVGVYPNEAYWLRSVSALLKETSEKWQIGEHNCAGRPLGGELTIAFSGQKLRSNVP